jgi:predicted DNA-binding protein with PD1-like motif
VKTALHAYTNSQKLDAAAVVSAVGSLTEVHLRLANADTTEKHHGHFEIVSLSGTLSPDGVHLHLAVADERGVTVGGHLMPGCLVYTTHELVLLEAHDLRFRRQLDSQTGYRELVIEKR